MGPPLADTVEGGSGPEDVRLILRLVHAGDTDILVGDLSGDPPHDTDPGGGGGGGWTTGWGGKSCGSSQINGWMGDGSTP